MLTKFNEFISNILRLTVERFNRAKKSMVKVLLAALLFGIIIINSGYAYTYLNNDTFALTLISIISFLVVGFLFVFTYDFNEIKKRFETRKVSFAFIALCLICISAVITMFSSNETEYLMLYVGFVVRVASAFIIAKLLNFRKFVQIFQHGMFVVCTISLFFYLLSFLSNTAFSIFNSFDSFKGETFINYFYIVFQGSHGRLQGPFWEPGLFASFIIIAMIFEILFYKKIRVHYFVIFFIALLFTNSTFGILALTIVGLIAINRKVKSFWLSAILYTLILGSLTVYIIFSDTIIPFLSGIFPNVFRKLVSGETSTLIDISRFFAPLANMQIFMESPIFGVGMHRASEAFLEKAKELNISAQTSTMTSLMASFGIFGALYTIFFFFGLFRMKKVAIEDKVLLAILFVLILNKEPHNDISFEWILIFITIKEFVDCDEKSLLYSTPSQNTLIASFRQKDDSSILKRNIAVSFIIKIASLVVGILTYPLYVSIFGKAVAGLLVTIFSIAAILITIDLGISNSLKNKLVVAISENDEEQKRKLLSTSFVSNLFIGIIILVILGVVIYTCDVSSFFNISSSEVNLSTLRLSLLIMLIGVALQMPLKNAISYLEANQRTGLSSFYSLLTPITMIIVLAVCSGMSLATNTALIVVAISFAIASVLPLLICNIIHIFGAKANYISLKSVSKETFSNLIKIGFGFFAIQMFLLVINSTNETIISNIFGTETASTYYVYTKVATVVSTLFSAITIPYWGMVAKEMVEKNSASIKKNLIKVLIIWFLFSAMLFATAFIYGPIADIWVGEGVYTIELVPALFVATFFSVWMLVMALSAFANGFNQIVQQTILFAVSAVIKIVGTVLLTTVFQGSAEWYHVVIVNSIAFIPAVVGLLTIVLLKIAKLKKGVMSNEKEK